MGLHDNTKRLYDALKKASIEAIRSNCVMRQLDNKSSRLEMIFSILEQHDKNSRYSGGAGGVAGKQSQQEIKSMRGRRSFHSCQF